MSQQAKQEKCITKQIKSIEELGENEELCEFCRCDASSSGDPPHVFMCEGRWCDEAYDNYLDNYFNILQIEKEE